MKTIFYIDRITQQNENLIWEAAFKRHFEKVYSYKLGSFTIRKLRKDVEKYNPDMIHYGGSIKKEKQIPIDFYKEMHKKGIRQTVYYADVYYNPYNFERAKYCNALHFTNYAFVRHPIFYFPSPCEPSLNDNSKEYDKKYDVVFIGSNGHPGRGEMLEKIAQAGIDVHVWGRGWNDRKYLFNYHGNIWPFEKAYLIYNEAKITLDDVSHCYCRYTHIDRKCEKNSPYYTPSICNRIDCPLYMPTIAYFSNRLVIAASAGTCIVCGRRNGIDLIFPDDSIIYANMDNIISKVEYCLKNENLRKIVGENAKKIAMKYRYDILIKKLMTFK